MNFKGEQQLREQMGTPRESCVHKINDHVYFFNYFGTSNATLIVGETSCILIDAFETDYYAAEAAKKIKEITPKPVKTIIFTHQHADHIGGSGVYRDTVERVIAHTSASIVYGKTHLLGNILKKRMIHQLGYQLTLEESLSTGLNPAVEVKGKSDPLAVTEWISERKKELTIDGISIVLIAAEGEADDQQYVWLPKDQIVCSGDNFYASWPNLYAIRGTQYRDVSTWINSLDTLLSLNSTILLPGHGQFLNGADEIMTTIKPYREAINYILEETLNGMNKGLTPDELVAAIKLPKEWAQLPQLQEYYGTIEWSIRGIYSGYVGWFDGNPTHLGTLPAKEKATKLLKLMGGAEKVLNEIATSMANEEIQWAVELCDILLDAQTEVEKAKTYKSQGLTYLGRMQTSANGRHYYLSVAKELKKTTDNQHTII